MQQTGNLTTSSFITRAGRLRNIGLVGSAMAVLISFIEAVTTHASKPSSDDVTAHDHAADISSDAARNTGHLSSFGTWFEAAAHQLPNNSSSFADEAHQLSNKSSSFADVPPQLSDNSIPSADAAQQLSDDGAPFAEPAQQLSNNGFSFDDAAHRLPNYAPSFADTTAGHAHDAALPDGAQSLGANDDNGSWPSVANSDSFWFNADGPVHFGLSADDSAHALTNNFAAVSDPSDDHSGPNAEVTFTSAESSLFHYSGPSILDTAPGGTSAHSTDAIDASASTIPFANYSAIATELNDFHQASSIANNNVSVIGGSDLKPEAANTAGAGAGARSAPDLEAWNGDLGTGYTMTAAGTAASGSSGSVPGVTSADHGQGLVINVVYDSSVASAPAGFTQTIANVVSFNYSQ